MFVLNDQSNLYFEALTIVLTVRSAPKLFTSYEDQWKNSPGTPDKCSPKGWLPGPTVEGKQILRF